MTMVLACHPGAGEWSARTRSMPSSGTPPRAMGVPELLTSPLKQLGRVLPKPCLDERATVTPKESNLRSGELLQVRSDGRGELRVPDVRLAFGAVDREPERLRTALR